MFSNMLLKGLAKTYLYTFVLEFVYPFMIAGWALKEVFNAANSLATACISMLDRHCCSMVSPFSVDTMALKIFLKLHIFYFSHGYNALASKELVI